MSALATVAVVLAAWLAVDHLVHPPAFIFPSVRSVAQAFLNPEVDMLRHGATTAVSAIVGLAFALVITSIAIVLAVVIPRLEGGIYTIGIALKATPVVAMAPLLIIWLGAGISSKIAAAALVSFFPVLVAALDSIKQTPAALVDMARAFGASRWEIFHKVRLPSSVPWLLSGLRVAAPLAIVGSVVGELVGARVGLGYLIVRASYQLQTDVVFAAIISAAGLAGILIGLVYLVQSATTMGRVGASKG